MLKQLLCSTALVLMSCHSVWAKNTHVIMTTTKGTIELELFDEKAPITTQNFKHYIKQGFYSDTIFHRVIPNFMIQGGGMTLSNTANLIEKENPTKPIVNEASLNHLQNERGTIAMARTSDLNSARSQFFINVKHNTALDGAYAVFGKVTKGLNVVDEIVNVPTTYNGMHQNVPKTPIKIIEIKIKP